MSLLAGPIQGPSRVGRQRAHGSQGRKRCVAVRASDYKPQYPDQQFIEEVKSQYVGQGMYAKPVADAEEARVLLSLGYAFLDVRSALDVDYTGKLRECVHIPYQVATRRWDSDEGKTVVTTSVNEAFLGEVAKRFPDKEKVQLLVADKDGRSGGMEALDLLESAGYENLVGIAGGFRTFWRVWDAKLARRPSRGAFREDPWSEGNSQGLFAGES
ncbi:hypothetical protein FOA52_006532 [Chlamydomonas sp. UWO 241]|nr:hypothetical protein FOA52_006532 [Chlamydomonas sp. UWO 241]